MFKITWDRNNNGVVLVESGSEDILVNVPPRPVFHEELDLLGFNKYWQYPKSEEPLLWACDRRYYYKGELVAEVRGGNIFDEPTISITDKGKSLELIPIDLKILKQVNNGNMFLLVNEAVQFIHDCFFKYRYNISNKKNKPNSDMDFAALAERLSKKTKSQHVVVKEDCDSFDIMSLEEAVNLNKPVYLDTNIDMIIASFSGGKDSQVTLDLITRAIPPSDFLVIYSDTGLELPSSHDLFNKTEEYYHEIFPNLKFLMAKNHKNVEDYWNSMGAPSRMQRWCCAVMKTAPLYKLLKDIHGDGKQPKVLAFEGVRAEESTSRSKYNRIGKGVKHNNVINARPIFNWNATEIYLYLLSRDLPFNKSYRDGLSRVGCSICPLSSEWSEHIINKKYPEKIKPYTDFIYSTTDSLGIISHETKIKYIKDGSWKVRAGGKTNFDENSRIDFISTGINFKAVLTNPKEDFFEWIKTLGVVRYNISNEINQGEIKLFNSYLRFTIERVEFKSGNELVHKLIIAFENCSDNILLISKIKKILYKTTFCINCEVCEIECPTGALSVVPNVKIDISKCIHCLKCIEINEKGCMMAKTINISEGTNNMGNKIKTSGVDKYSTFGLKEKWLRDYFDKYETYFIDGNNELGVKMIPAMINWLRDAEILNRENKNISEIGMTIKNIYKIDLSIAWELIWINLSFNSGVVSSFITHTNAWGEYSKKELIAYMMEDYPNISEATISNPIGALINMIDNTPLGYNEIIATLTKKGNAVINIIRNAHENLSASSVVYSLYRYAEKKGRYQLRVSEFYDMGKNESLVAQFGIARSKFEMILRNLSEREDKLVYAELNMGLDNISLREDLTAIGALNIINKTI